MSQDFLKKFSNRRQLSEISVLTGYSLVQLPDRPLSPNARCVIIPSEDAPYLTFTDEDFSLHTLFIGGIGSGKTNAIFQLVRQIKDSLSEDDVMFIFDYKGDFYQTFYSKEKDIVFSNSKNACGLGGQKNYWNIFEELYPLEDYKIGALEIASFLFSEKIKKTQQVFFPEAARDLLAALFIHFVRAYRQDGLYMTNGGFRTLMDITDSSWLIDVISEHEDLRAIVSYIRERESPQTQGVLSELYQAIREYFIGNFAKDGDLSVREIVRKKGGVTVFLEYDAANAKALTPVYGALLDIALKEALSQERTKGNVWLLLDELSQLPYLDKLNEGLNVGRSLGIKIIAGIQSINLIKSKYGNEMGLSMLNGFNNIFAFRVIDAETREYIQRIFGKQRRIELYGTHELREPMEHVTEGYVVEDWMINTLKTGQAIVSLPALPPFSMRFALYNDEGIRQKAKEVKRAIAAGAFKNSSQPFPGQVSQIRDTETQEVEEETAPRYVLYPIAPDPVDDYGFRNGVDLIEEEKS